MGRVGAKEMENNRQDRIGNIKTYHIELSVNIWVDCSLFANPLSPDPHPQDLFINLLRTWGLILHGLYHHSSLAPGFLLALARQEHQQEILEGSGCILPLLQPGCVVLSPCSRAYWTSVLLPSFFYVFMSRGC